MFRSVSVASRALLLFTVLAGGLGLLSTLPAIAAQPTVTVDPPLAPPGGKVTLSGSGWPSGISLVARMYLANDPSGAAADLGMAFQTDAQGSFTTIGTVPVTLFSPSGNRGNLTVVPGQYTVVVSADPDTHAQTDLTVGAPSGAGLLWGEVYFDSSGNGQRDAGDTPAQVEVHVLRQGESVPRTAITDLRGRYLLLPLPPGVYSATVQVKVESGTWVGSATTQVEVGKVSRADLLLLLPGAEIDPTRCFAQTGFCVSDDAFWDYFLHRGGIDTLGYPISRSFLFNGRPTQFFQRLVLQREGQAGCGNNCGGVQPLNLLDPGLLPYTHINGSQFPAVDDAVKAATPRVGSPDYDTKVVEFVRQYASNELNGRRVGFYDAFVSTVTCKDAFPKSDCQESLLPLLNLEIWGAPISRPTPDPNNSQFIYLRFQRGIMHYQGPDAQGSPITEGILLADWFKSVITGWNLPSDLRQEAQADNSPYLLQYCPGNPRWLCHPELLPTTDLTLAFERET